MTGQGSEAPVGGYHDQVFRFLGPHAVNGEDAPPRWEVRAFLPQAESAAIVTAAGLTKMAKKQKDGFFVASLKDEPANYRITARLYTGHEVELVDPYRFGPQIPDTDLYLHTEGTLYEAWRIFGAHLAEAGGV